MDILKHRIWKPAYVHLAQVSNARVKWFLDILQKLINATIQVENLREFSYFLEKYYITSHLPFVLFSYEENKENIKFF